MWSTYRYLGERERKMKMLLETSNTTNRAIAAASTPTAWPKVPSRTKWKYPRGVSAEDRHRPGNEHDGTK